MSNLNTSFNDLVNEVESLISTEQEIAKLALVEKISVSSGVLLSAFVILILFIISLLFASVGIGIYLGKYFGNFYTGFGIVAIAYFILALILYFCRTYIQSPITNSIIKALFKESNHD